MSWNRTATQSTTTQHTCGGPVFGRKTAGCPRCDELLAGAAPVQWAGGRERRVLTDPEYFERIRRQQRALAR